MAKKKQAAVLQFPIKFGNVSIGKKTAKVSVETTRKNVTLSVADKQLADKRLTGILLSRCGDASATQVSLPGAEGNDIEIEGVFDVKKISFDADGLKFGLTFIKKGVDKNDLAAISGTEGELIINVIDEIPDKEKDEDDEETE